MEDDVILDPEPDPPHGTVVPTRPTELLDARRTERYVPRDLTCAECGCGGEEFRWFQRVEAAELAAGTPESDLHFCSIVCLGLYCADREAWDCADLDLLAPGTGR